MLARSRKGFTNLVGVFIGLMVVIIIAVSVVLPTVQDVINQGNFSGTIATLLGVVPLLIVIVIVLLIVGLMKVR